MHLAMDAWLDATYLLLAVLQADCRSQQTRLAARILTLNSFAFVEYESRRDADDAYHEMHNKRIGRDDLLKIEVRPALSYLRQEHLLTCDAVGSHSALRLLAI